MDYLFYDYETTGVNKQFDQVLQFAAIKTDSNFNIIDEPVNLLCKLRKDIIPSPYAIKTTEIKIDELNENGICEFEFAKEVEKVLVGSGGQCITGYNSKSFDDKFTQFLFYRNFIDPYRWGWDSQNKKLDVYDIILMGYSFDKLNGIQLPSEPMEGILKLENLAKYNELEHENAHDALSDVIATIELIKKVKSGNPKLIEYAISMQNKNFVRDKITKPGTFYNISSFYGYENKFLSAQYAISVHPQNANSYISWNLKFDPELILEMNPDEIRFNMFCKKEDRLVEVGFTEIKMNQCPSVIKVGQSNIHSKIDIASYKTNQEKVTKNLKKLISLSNAVFKYDIPLIDADADLYAGNFFGEKDIDEKSIKIVYSEPVKNKNISFKSDRFTILHKRLKGRNYFDYISESEQEEFMTFCKERYFYSNDDKWLTLNKYHEECDQLKFSGEILSENQKLCLDQLDSYVKNLS